MAYLQYLLHVIGKSVFKLILIPLIACNRNIHKCISAFHKEAGIKYFKVKKWNVKMYKQTDRLYLNFGTKQTCNKNTNLNHFYIY